MAKSNVKLTLQKLTVYRGVDLFLLNGLMCVIFLGTQIHSSFSVSTLMDEIDRYWKLKLN